MSDKRALMTMDEISDAIDLNDYKASKPIDFSVKKNRFDYDGDEFVLITGNKEKRITPSGIKNLMYSVDLPSSLPNKMKTEPELMAKLINGWAENKGLYMRSLSRRNSVVSFVDNDQTLISNNEILAAAKSALKEPLFDTVHTGDDGKSMFSIVSEAGKKMNIGKNDRFLGGIRVENNPLRSRSTKIESYLERLVCLNGQISTSAHWSAPRNIEDDVSSWLTSSITYARNESESMFKSIANLADKVIDANMMDFLENMYEQLKVPEKVRDLISRRVAKEGAKTLYDLFNHITYVASNYRALREDPELSARLMRIGGHFAEHIEETCQSCNRPAFAVAE